MIGASTPLIPERRTERQVLYTFRADEANWNPDNVAVVWHQLQRTGEWSRVTMHHDPSRFVVELIGEREVLAPPPQLYARMADGGCAIPSTVAAHRRRKLLLCCKP